MPMHSYLVCATQRSGSTLLCELLKDTGVAGRPEEYFEARLARRALPPHPGDYLEDLPRTGAGIRDDSTPPRAPDHSSLLGLESYRDHLDRTFRARDHRTACSAPSSCGATCPTSSARRRAARVRGTRSAELLERLFDRPRYVWVTRRDKVRQAISLWRALQTRAWRLEHAGDGQPARRAAVSIRGHRPPRAVAPGRRRGLAGFLQPAARSGLRGRLRRRPRAGRGRARCGRCSSTSACQPPAGWRRARSARSARRTRSQRSGSRRTIGMPPSERAVRLRPARRPLIPRAHACHRTSST